MENNIINFDNDKNIENNDNNKEEKYNDFYDNRFLYNDKILERYYLNEEISIINKLNMIVMGPFI